MANPSSRRYPLTPLAEMAGMTERQALLAMKVSGKQYQLYRDVGMLRDTADRMAIRLGFHPYEVWPEMSDHDIEEVSFVCAAEDCTNTFMRSSSQSRKRFCSDTCTRRVKQRRYRDRHPEQQEKDRERARRYHAETQRYQRMRTQQRAVRERQQRALRRLQEQDLDHRVVEAA